MKSEDVLLEWSESEQLQVYLRREVRRAQRFGDSLKLGGLALVVTIALFAEWFGADPNRRVVVWWLPVFAFVFSGLFYVILVIPEKYVRNKMKLKRSGFQYGSILRSRENYSYSDFESFSFSKEESESGLEFNFLELSASEECGDLQIEVPDYVDSKKIREIILEAGLREVSEDKVDMIS